MTIDLEKLRDSVLSGVPHDPACGLTSAAYQALARATSVRDGQAVIGGEPHGLVQRQDGLWALGIGEDTPGPIDPDKPAL